MTFQAILMRNCMKKPFCSRLSSFLSFPDIDTDYLCNPKNTLNIIQNIELRKGVGDIERAINVYKLLKDTPATDSSYIKLRKELNKELCLVPNNTHPLVQRYGENPCLIREINVKKDFGDYKPLEFSVITRRLNLLRTDKLGNTCGQKSYYFLGELAELEEALIKYTISFLLNREFELISVPDILPSNVLESCGMSINSDRTQVYSLDPLHHGPDLYLSGTAEMSLAGLLMGSIHEKHTLPLKLAAVSRCYRAETSNIIEERGIYRVHQFTKVEMFVVATPEESENMLENIRQIQEELFSALGLHMIVLDMPPHELGAPAYRKYDIEAWMPGRKTFGEISSCSNCTDYQSRRLHIKYEDHGSRHYVHTLNGTACAVPRMVIALIETHQDPKGKILIPKVLQPFMNGKEYIVRNNLIPELKLMKIKK